MSVGLQVAGSYREVGAAIFFHAFFSTVSAHLEPAGWGSRFPSLMHRLFQGQLPAAEAAAAKAELATVHEELGGLPPTAIVWDLDDRSKRPPWDHDIDPGITSLAGFFLTSEGKDLFEVLFAALDDAAQNRHDVVIQ